MVEKFDCSSNDECCINEPGNHVQDGSVEGSSSHAGVDSKLEVSSAHIRVEKLATSVKERSSSKKKNSPKDEKSSEIKPEASYRNVSPGNGPVISKEAATRIGRKRKHKVYTLSDEKKCKSDEGKSTKDSSGKAVSKEKVARPGIAKSKGKRKIFCHGDRITPLNQDVVDKQLKNEVDIPAFHIFCSLLVLIQVKILSFLLDLILCLKTITLISYIFNLLYEKKISLLLNLKLPYK